jgi:hypothetical protein
MDASNVMVHELESYGVRTFSAKEMELSERARPRRKRGYLWRSPDSSRRLPLRPRREDREVPESDFPEVNEQEDDILKDKETLRSRP